MESYQRQKPGGARKKRKGGQAAFVPSPGPEVPPAKANRPVRPPARPAPRKSGWPRWASVAVAVLLAIGVAVGGYFAVANPGGTASPSLGERIPDEGRGHVPAGSPIQYQHNPPSSGSHYPSPQPWGVSSQPVAPGYFVHSMEHGGVVVLYDCPSGCPEIVSQLEQAYRSFPRDKYGEVKLVVSPYQGLPNGAQVSALAWDYELDFSKGFDVNQLRQFYQAHVDHGPENIP